ncbi:EamA family transporter [Micromonospora yasonensis]|uniref:EamA family transporter n=1 Tax=Micromonospora yasonensis TaxID=1128667 RepID=UPI002231542D|nr:EamA family transporter [Micromonospora yasonensis]MCW3845395.1 EamA family transporter [Micromonospora yasonensis]
MLSNRTAVILVTAAVPSVWGSTYLVTTELLPPGRPLLAATIRALPAGLALVAITRRLPTGDWWWRATVLGALNIGAFFALLFVAAYRLPGGVAATVGAIQPLMVAGFAALLLAQRLTLRVGLCAVAGFAGVSLLVLRANAQIDTLGLTAALGGAISMALGVVLSKRWTPPVPVLASTGWQLVAGGLLLLPVTLLVEGAPPAHLTLENTLGYAYLAIVGSAIAYTLWFRGISLLSPTEVTFLGLLSPLVATTLGWLVLDQRLTPAQVAGAVTVLASVIIVQTTGPRPQPAAAAPPPAAPEPAHTTGAHTRG